MMVASKVLVRTLSRIAKSALIEAFVDGIGKVSLH